MDNLNTLSEQDLSIICDLVLPFCKPGRFFYAGSLANRVAEFARNAGAESRDGTLDGGITTLVAGWGEADLSSAARVEDCFLFEQDALASAVGLPANQFAQRFGDPGKIFFILFPDSGQVLLPSAANLLFQLGYVRDFSVGLWLEERGFACAFTRQPARKNLVELYEAEWWREAVLNQKRRRLLQETLHELTQTIHFYERKVIEQENRWDAFWNSRSGKLVRLIEKMRKNIPF